jgi:hypothetical protein
MSHGKVEELPDQFDDDLHPDNRAGQHAGVSDTVFVPASEFKELHERLPQFQSGDLKRIMVVRTGERLEQGAVYCDLADFGRGEFKAMGGTAAEPGHYYVAKAETDYPLWNRLIGVDDPARTAADPRQG